MDINLFALIEIFALIFVLIGQMGKNKFFSLFPFFGALVATYLTTTLGADGSIYVAYTGTVPIAYSDWPMLLIPMFTALLGFIFMFLKVINRI